MTSNDIARATRQAGPWVERAARIGFFAIGIVYIIAGGLTAFAALGQGGDATDRQEALSFILEKPFGKFVLVLMAIGLAGYAFWRILSGIVDSDRRGSDLKGWRARGGAIASGIIYVLLTLEIIRMVRGGSGSGGGDDTAHWVSRVMEWPFGRSLVVVAGMIIVIVGVYQLLRAWKSDLSKRLNLGALETRTRHVVVSLSRFGMAARGVVFAIIGISVVTAAIRYEPGTARGLSGAYSKLLEQPFGHLLLAIVALGFVAYGVYAIVNGLYRRIDVS